MKCLASEQNIVANVCNIVYLENIFVRTNLRFLSGICQSAAEDWEDRLNGMASHAEASVEPVSLEYMEDPYFLAPDDDSTPSFDVAVDELDELENIVNWPQDDTEAEWRALPDLAESALCIETEFYMDNRRRRLRIFRKKMREVRVTFQDLSKPYLARMSSHTNYKKFLGITPGGSFHKTIFNCAKL